MAYTFRLVDVFGVEDFSGNPLAVIHDADDLDADAMQRITLYVLADCGEASDGALSAPVERGEQLLAR